MQAAIIQYVIHIEKNVDILHVAHHRHQVSHVGTSQWVKQHSLWFRRINFCPLLQQKSCCLAIGVGLKWDSRTPQTDS